MRSRVSLVLLAFMLVWAGVGVSAEEGAGGEPAPELARRLHSLQDIVRTRDQLRSARSQQQRELVSDSATGREDRIRAAIGQISEAIEQLDQAFALIASEVDPRRFDRVATSEDVPLTEEVKELLAPVVSELKRATKRPREIDRLRTEIAETSEQVAAMERALANLDQLIAAATVPELIEALRIERGEWESRLQTERTHLSVSSERLDQQLSERKSISEAFDQLFELFFRSRGRNLLIALAVTLAFFLVLRRLHEAIRRRGPFGRRAPSLATRIFDLAYLILTVVGALLVFIIVLYFFGDWVLLIGVVVVLLGLAWASKQAIPRFWSQVTLLLDMGPVRDGERVQYSGLPFRVDSLGLYSQLVNPLLEGGPIRLPISDLGALRSRPGGSEEPWFPTQKGDWVLMQDGTYGQVDFQSVETVRLRRAGGCERSYPAAQFASLAPDVLSRGFLVLVKFGIDYRHQRSVTREVVDVLRAHLEGGIAAAGHAEWSRKLSVEFQEAAASSLDLAILWELDGSAAGSLYPLRRLINRLCVEACNENGWVIPFSQVTVHRADAEA